jgi:hypothetical protein
MFSFSGFSLKTLDNFLPDHASEMACAFQHRTQLESMQKLVSQLRRQITGIYERHVFDLRMGCCFDMWVCE